MTGIPRSADGSSRRPVGAAVVGLGIGTAHAAGYLRSPHARLAAVADEVSERRRGPEGIFATGAFPGLRDLYSDEQRSRSWKDLGARVYENLDTILGDPDVELVSLCTPDHTHPEAAEKVLAAGKHLLVEKPVAVHRQGTDRFETAIRRYDPEGRRFIAVGYEFRINPAMAAVRDAVEKGTIGDPVALSISHTRTPFRRDKIGGWIQTKALTGGLLVEETSHWLDLARFLVGREPETVHAVKNGSIHPDFDFEDVAYVNGTYAGGGIFSIGHALTGVDFSFVLQVHGTQGSLFLTLKEEKQSLYDGGATDWRGFLVSSPLNGDPGDAETRRWDAEATEPENIADYAGLCARALRFGKGPRGLGETERGLASEDDFAAICGFSEGRRALYLSLTASEAADENEVKSCHWK